jgi:HrpA-like RNA helicase
VSSPELGLEIPQTKTDPVYDPQLLETLGNPDLPMLEQRHEFAEKLNNNRVVLVEAPTGTGKSTQAPQYALGLRRFDRIQESQPRRRAALNVARRIREEIALVLGDEVASDMVASHTGGGREGEYNAPVMVMTEGVMSRRYLHEGMSFSKDLWVLDEAHENSNEFWVLAGMAKRRLETDPEFSVVVMTATPDLDETIEFWTDDVGVEPAIVKVEGGTNFEIEHLVEEDTNTAREAVKAAFDIFENPEDHDDSNTIQIFESGVADIKETIKNIRDSLPARILAKTTILPLHAKLSPAQQQLAFEDVEGIKIVVQTNIGKTSTTMPRTRYVIDSGLERTIVLDEEGGERLMYVYSSRSCMTQKKGRAGRTSTGKYIHTKHGNEPFVPYDSPLRQSHLTPEIERSDLSGVTMLLAEWGVSIRDFESKPVAPIDAINIAVHKLQQLGALDDHEQITRLGERMMRYPVSPERQRSLAEAEKYSQRIRLFMAAMVAATESGGLRAHSNDHSMWERSDDETDSDLFRQLNMFLHAEKRGASKKAEVDFDVNNVTEALKLYRKIAHRAGIKEIPRLSAPTVEERKILHECIMRGHAQSAFIPVERDADDVTLFKSIAMAKNKEGILRQIGRRSVVSPQTNRPVVATPFGIEFRTSRGNRVLDLLDHVTVTNMQELGKYAASSTVWMDVGYVLRGGKFVVLQEQHLGQRLIGTREKPVPDEGSPALRAAVIEYIKVDPGMHLKQLYKIKSELEALNRISKNQISTLSQDDIDTIIESVTPQDVKSPGHVDYLLKQLIEKESITLDTFVTAEERERIRKDAPNSIEVDGFRLKLQYSQHKPTVKNATIEMVLGMTEEPRLPDGREIMFMLDGKRYTLHRYRQLLTLAGEL